MLYDMVRFVRLMESELKVGVGVEECGLAERLGRKMC